MIRGVGLAVAAAAIVATGACWNGDGDLDAFCAGVVEAETFAFDLQATDFDVDAAVDQLSQAADLHQQLRDDAPREVRDDLDVLIDYENDLVAGLEAHRTDPPPPVDDSGRTPQPAVLDELEDREPDVRRANTRLARFVDANCDRI